MKGLAEELIESNSPNLPNDFVGAAVYIREDGYPFHAGLAIGYRGTAQLFHFTEDEKLEFAPLAEQKWYVHKELVPILPDLAAPFLNHCKKIAKLSPPIWGLYYNGAYFKDGKLFNKEGLPYYMSCVGFCIAVLNGFGETEHYLQHTDWTPNNSINDLYFEEKINDLLAKHKDLSRDDIKDDIKRIKPIEYLATGYYHDYPIRKADTDKITEELKAILKSKRLAN